MDKSLFLVVRYDTPCRELSYVHNHGMKLLYSWTLRSWGLAWTGLIILYPALFFYYTVATILFIEYLLLNKLTSKDSLTLSLVNDRELSFESEVSTA